MYQTLTNVQNEEAIQLQQYIDNRSPINLRVGIKSITYTVGWYNIKQESFMWRNAAENYIYIYIKKICEKYFFTYFIYYMGARPGGGGSPGQKCGQGMWPKNISQTRK